MNAGPDTDTATLTGLFATAVARFADRPAASDDEQTLTYADLDRRSTAFADVLRGRGVAAGHHVGIVLDRSVDVFVAVLAVLRTGAAYVPVDTRYPDARRDLMLATSRAQIVVTRPEWREQLEGRGLDVLPLRSRPITEAQPPQAVPDVPDAALPDGAASVLFTSGSTGVPKAIVLEHRNIVSYATNPSLPRLVPGDRTGQISSLSFDAFHFEMWTTLLHGAEVAVLPPVPDLLASDFQGELRRRRITAMLAPTMVVNHVVREDPDAFAPLRILQAGGDVLLPSACRDVLAGGFVGELYNVYGPTETTTACTMHRVTTADVVRDAVPIGRPLHGVTVRLLGPDLRPVAPGEIGEVVVCGPGVARGYLGAPVLTDERFVPDPDAPGAARRYRTGDLASERADGVLEFRGRADTQVKIRGYRVEPGEVERGLRSHPQVHDVVVLPTDSDSNRRLVAFVVLDEPVPMTALRAHAAAELPDFMVPGLFVTLPEIPTTDHGKRDRTQLPALLEQYEARERSWAPPATETEHRLAHLWESLLGVESVGSNDDFFELGGHSLLAFRLQRRVRRELGVVLEYRTVLANSVLAGLAAEIDVAKDEVSMQ